jgi:N-carbamoylputrescine amidase
MASDAGEIELALIQSPDRGDPSKNLERHEQLVREAVEQGAELVCLQELFRTEYLPRVEDPDRFDWAEEIPGETTDRLGALANELDVVIVAPIFEERTPGVYHNSAAVIEQDGSIAGVYRKTHIPHDPNFFEKYYFTPGDEGPLVVETSAGTIGLMICWDQWFPEPARLAALEGADVILYPTCIGHADADEDVAEDQREAWLLAQRAHALANEVYVAAANRVGREAPITFWGASFVAGPFGKVHEQAPVGEEHVLHATLDLDRSQQMRKTWPFLRDRRPDLYEGLTRRLLDD